MENSYFKYKRLIVAASLLVILLSLTAIIGWICSRTLLTSLVAARAPMKFTTATSLILLSISLLIIVSSRSKWQSFPTAILASGIGLSSLSPYILNINLFTLVLPRGNYAAKLFEMTPHSAICIVILAAAFIFIRSKNTTIRIICQYLCHAVTLLTFIVFTGYLYGIPEMYNLFFNTAMAVPTAISFVSLSVAATLLNPSLGFTAMFTGNRIGNMMARRLYFLMLTALLITGYLRILGHRRGIVSAEFGAGLLTVTFCIISLVLVYRVSAIINKAHAKVHAAKENMKTVIESSPYALIIADEEGTITKINQRTEILFGYTEEELMGKKLRDLLPAELSRNDREERRSFFEDGLVRILGVDEEILSKRKGGKKFPIEMHLVPIKTEDSQIVLAFIIDITSRKASEKIIINQLAELQSKNLELEQFNYISSHDLQEPLRTVLNYIEMLQEDYPELDDSIKTHLVTMEATVLRMSTVVRSLLDFGKLGQNKKLAYTDCNEVIKHVIADLDHLLNKNGATIIVDDTLPTLFAYKSELGQLFQNLINNAVKFQKPDSKPRVNIGHTENNGYYEFYVSDNGIGIAPNHLEDIFNIFNRLNDKDSYEGHGIGLANCRKIAEMHGGRMWVESEVNKGSKFKFTLIKLK